jgi:hypothetical protein
VCSSREADVVQHWQVAACPPDGIKHAPAAVNTGHAILQRKTKAEKGML